MTAFDFEAWHQARLGKLTSSRIGSAIKRTKAGWSTARRGLMLELLAERMTGQPIKQYLNEAMLWGVEQEAKGRETYARRTDSLVTEVMFVDHPRIPNAGCSPDGLVNDDGLIEIKCQESKTFVGFLLERQIPEEHMAQMQWQMACCERKWCDYVLFDPRMPAKYAMLTTRVPRNETLIKELEGLGIGFLVEMARAQEMIEGMHVNSEDIAATL